MKKLLAFLFFILTSLHLQAADYYWVGGGGNWSDVNHWRLGSTAGSIPSIVPAAGDNVFFTAGSGFGATAPLRTVTMNANAFCNNMTWDPAVPNNPVFTRVGTSRLSISGNLTLAPTVTFTSILADMVGGTNAVLTTNGNVLGSLSISVNKPGSGVTLADNLIYAIPNGTANYVDLTEGYFNAAGKTFTAYALSSDNTNTRNLNISNASVNLAIYNYQGTNKVLDASNSIIKTTRFYADEGTYYIAEIGTAALEYLSINNITCQKITFINTSATSEARIHNNNIIDTILFLGSGGIRSSNNKVNHVEFNGNGGVGGSGNIIKFAEAKKGFNIIDGGNNVFDTLLTAANYNINIAGTNTINKYFRAGGLPCDGFTEITGSASATLAFAPGATADIDNVLLTNMAATGNITPITVNGIDNEGNTGFVINEPASAGTTLYWVNGGGDWNDKSHWSTSSGGAPGACIPFIGDDVVFDANSGFTAGNNIVATTGNTYCKNMSWLPGVPASPIFNKSASFYMSVYGSVVLEPTVRMNGALDLRGTASVTLAVNGSSLGNLGVIVRKTNPANTSGLTLLDDWSNATASVNLSRGVLDLHDRTINIGSYVSNSGLARNLKINNAKITVINWTYSGFTKTMDATNSTILITGNMITRDVTYNIVECTATHPNFDISNTTFGYLLFSNPVITSSARIGGGNTIRRLEFKGQGLLRLTGNVIDSLITAENRNFYFYEGTTTINKYFKATHPSCSGLGEIRTGGTTGTIFFAPNTVVDISNVYMENIAATGGGGSLTLPIPFSGADAGGNSGWTINSSAGSARYWVGGSGDWNDASHWSTTSGGAGGACIPTIGDDVYFDGGSGFTAASKTITVSAGNAYFRNMSWNGALNAPILNKSGSWTMEGWGSSIILNPAVTLNVSTLRLMGPLPVVMTGETKGDFDLEIYKAGSGFTLANDYNNPLSDFYIHGGYFNAAGRTLTAARVDNGALNNAVAIDISGSTINVGLWRFSGLTTQRSLNAANSVINGTIIATGFTYDIVNVPGTASAVATINNTIIKQLTLTDPNVGSAAGINGAGNTIGRVEYKGSGSVYGTGNIIDTLIFFPGNIYQFAPGTNTTITGEWFGSGTPCRLTEIRSGHATLKATVTKTSGTVDFDYIRLRNMIATGGAAFNVKEHSTDQGGNTGWTIAPYNGSSPILGLGPDVTLCATGFPYEINTDGFFGSPSSQFTWSDGSTQDKLIVAGPGIYRITVSFPDGCSVKDTIEIIQSVVPVNPITGTLSVCIGSTTSLGNTTPGGVWSSSSANATVSASGVVTGVSVGTAVITYTVTNGLGCVNAVTATVTVNALPVVAAISGTLDVCVGSTTSLASTTPGGVWSSSSANATVSATGVVTGVSAGNAVITYTVTNGDGCVAAVTATVTVNALPVVAAITGTLDVCIGGTVSLGSTTPGGVWSSSSGNAAVSATGVVTGVSAGSSIITYTVTNGSGCVTAVTATVTVNALPVVNALSGTLSVCIGSTTALASTTAGGVWSSSSANATVSATGVVTGVSAGSAVISYTVTNGSGCVTAVTATVTVNALPVVNALSGTLDVCVGSTTSLASTTPGGVWNSSSANATVSATGVVTGVSAGSAVISYTVTNGSGCVTAATATVTVNALPVVNALSGTLSVCIGSTTALASTTPGGVWSSSSANATVSATGVVTGVSAGSAVISYTVTNGSGCVTAVTATVSVNALPVVAAITGTLDVCVGSAIALANTTVGGVWSSSSANATVSATGVVTGVSAGTAVISYTVTNGSGCVTAATATVTVNALPVVAALSGTLDVCVGSTTSLSSTTPGGVWSSSSANATVSATGVVTGVSAGTAVISYTVTNGSGCVTAVTATVTVNALPVVNAITGTLNVCIGSTTALANSTAGGVWSSSSANATVSATGVVTGVSAGSAVITYTVTNGAGCIATVSATVIVNALPVVNAITGTLDVCIGSTTALANATAGGVWSSSSANATVSATGVVTGVSAGTAVISYTVTNGSGCVTAVTATVTVNALPVVNAITGTLNVCIGSTTALANTTAGGVWGSSSANATVSATGVVTGVSAGSAVITYTVTNGAGCIATVSATVIVNALPVVNAITGTLDVCIGSTTALANSTAGGVWSSSSANATVIATGVVTGVSTGTAVISYTVTNGSGCVTVVTATVTVNALPVVAAITGTLDVCIGSTTALANTTAGGVWSSSSANATVSATGVITGVSAGTAVISYTVTNVSGCVTVVTATVTVNALPVVAAITGTLDVCIGSTTALANATASGVWSSSSANATVSATGVIAGVSAGTAVISYTVTNVSGCVTVVTATVTVNALPAVAAITGTLDVCVGSTTALANTTAGGVWSSSSANATVSATGVVTGVSAGIAVITYTFTNGSGCVTAVSTTVTVNALPVVAAITGTLDVCVGSTTALANTTAGGVWSSSSANATVSATGIVTGVSAGSAVITYTVTNGSGCVTAVTAAVMVNALPVVNAITGTLDVCVGSTTSLASTTPGGVWSSSSANATVSATGVVTGVSAGSAVITYTVTNASGCVTDVTATVTVNALPVVNAITGTLDVCIGSTTSLANTTPGGVWSSSSANATVSATGIVTGVAAGTAVISYTVTNISGCVTVVTATVTVNALPVVTAITGTSDVCVGSTTALANTTTGGVWSSSSANATVSATGVVTGVSAGTAVITYTVTNGSGCVAAVTTIVTVNGLPVVNAIIGTLNTCVNSTTTLSNITTGGIWSSSSANATVSATGVVTGVSAGTVVITYTVTNGSGCVTAVNATVTVNSLPVVNAITGTPDVCVGSATTLSNTTTGGVWSSSDATIATVSATGIVTGIAAGSTVITYTVTNGPGCSANVNATVTVNALPVVNTITGTLNACTGATTTLASTTPGGVWSSSDASIATVNAGGIVTGVAAGTVTITYVVTNTSGCQSNQTATVTINVCTNPDPPVANNDVAITYEDVPVVINLTANDMQNAGTIDVSSVTITQQPAHGILTIHGNGSVTYSPTTAYTGNDNFSYTVKNALGIESNIAAVAIVVRTMPRAVNDSIHTNPDTKVIIPVLNNDRGDADLTGINITQQPAHGSLTINPDGTVLYTPVMGYKGLDVFRYTMKDVSGTVSNIAAVHIIVGADGLFIPNGITPNNDGVNDRFVIPGLSQYPGTTLNIFNRWGNEIYYSPNYDNKWDGNGLSGGTYYYILKLKTPQGVKVYKGWIQILR